MGSRTLPITCVHGTTIDWGDFGHQDYHGAGCSTCNPRCGKCDAISERRESKRADLRRRAVIQAKTGNYWAQRCLDLLDGKV